MRELVPAAARVAVLFNPTNLATDAQMSDVQAAARAMGLQLQVFNATTSREIDAAFAAMARERPDALFFIPDPVFNGRRIHLVHLASRHALPAVYWQREFAEAGGLIAYGSSIGECVSPGRRLHRSHPQGRQARRPAGRAVGQVRAGDQPPDRAVRSA